MVDDFSKNYEKQIKAILEKQEKERKEKLMKNKYKDYKNELINLCETEMKEGNQYAQILINMIQEDDNPIFEDKYIAYLNTLYSYNTTIFNNI